MPLFQERPRSVEFPKRGRYRSSAILRRFPSDNGSTLALVREQWNCLQPWNKKGTRYTCRPSTVGIHESHAAPKPAKLGNWTKRVPRKHKPPKSSPLFTGRPDGHPGDLSTFAMCCAWTRYLPETLPKVLFVQYFAPNMSWLPRLIPLLDQEGDPVFLFGNGRTAGSILLLQSLDASAHHLLAELGHLRNGFRRWIRNERTARLTGQESHTTNSSRLCALQTMLRYIFSSAQPRLDFS